VRLTTNFSEDPAIKVNVPNEEHLVVVLLAQQIRSAFFFGHISFSKVVTSILQSSLQPYPNNLFVTVLSYFACKNQSKTLFPFKISFPVFINPEISSLFEVD
jgi:hypothetical protein